MTNHIKNIFIVIFLIPTRTYQAQSGGYCREYEQTVTISGDTQTAYGKACRQPDGNWQRVD